MILTAMSTRFKPTIEKINKSCLTLQNSGPIGKLCAKLHGRLMHPTSSSLWFQFVPDLAGSHSAD
jgi:hypothetical protein